MPIKWHKKVLIKLDPPQNGHNRLWRQSKKDQEGINLVISKDWPAKFRVRWLRPNNRVFQPVEGIVKKVTN